MKLMDGEDIGYFDLAQSVEQNSFKVCVAGSIPAIRLYPIFNFPPLFVLEMI